MKLKKLTVSFINPATREVEFSSPTPYDVSKPGFFKIAFPETSTAWDDIKIGDIFTLTLTKENE
jgi:hypothetical protein